MEGAGARAAGPVALPVRSCPSLVCLLLLSWWQPVCFLPRAHGDTQHCRKALHRAVQCTSDYPEHVCEVLLTMERTEGGTLSAASGLESVRIDCVRLPLEWRSVT